MNTTNRFLSMALAMGLAMSVTGCVCTTGQSGDVTFTWTFDGRSMCSSVPDVDHVQITIPGHTLQNSGSFPCQTQGTAGITLLNFGPGTYSFTVEGQSSRNVKLFSAAGKFVVNGDIAVAVDLKSDPSAPATAYVTWTFPPNGATNGQPATCAQAGVTGMYIQLDGQAVTGTITCQAGQTSPGVALTMAPGQHQIDIAAAVGSGTSAFYLYRKVANLTAVAGNTAVNQYTVDWNAGSINLAWTLNGGTCAAAGATVVDVYVLDAMNAYQDLPESPSDYTKFTDPQGRITYRFNCLMNGAMGARIPYVYPGTYRIAGAATGAQGLYATNNANLPTATVTAGTFTPAATNLPLVR